MSLCYSEQSLENVKKEIGELEYIMEDWKEDKLQEISKNLEKTEVLSFDELSDSVKNLHSIAYSSTVKAINRFATIRKFLIGFYIVEYEQNGKDRATYGEKLLKKLEEKVKTKGLNETLFKNCRKFYLNYPQVKDFLLQKSPTASDEFTTTAEKLVSNLSFSHIVEILTIDNKFERFFYETDNGEVNGKRSNYLQ